ncbi:MAG: universal stress protein [Betaproteobacteria bacterium]|jgi:nucleotide-binding universal stress UspA family protein|nr:universal stress protein [Betaproteobacteria bacterium]MCC7215302.1 universal stress protein [Burkholderiales bacterium]
MYKHILIPTDGSRASARAAAAGVELAKSVGAKITGFFAAPPATPVVFKQFLPVGYMSPDEHKKAIERAAAAYLGAIERAAKRAGVPYQGVQVVSDFPAEAILRAAAKGGCDLVFMAPHSRRGLAELFVGSQTQKVLTHAKIPVLVYR